MSHELPFPCPCCGYRVHAESMGSYAICPICFWEDDGDGLYWPDEADPCNAVSLIDAQDWFRKVGACLPEMVPHVRPVSPADVRDVGWRPATAADNFERRTADVENAHRNLDLVYYWRRRG